MEYLRETVRVSQLADAISVLHVFWSIDLPRDWAESTPGMLKFLSGVEPISSVSTKDAETSNVLGLLRLARCVTTPLKDEYQLSEVRDLFISLCISWHGHYYSHPLWTRLREATLSRNALVAWIIHNYHLSQSAGATAARCATRESRKEVKRVFLESAIEEYSHCREYYAVAGSRLGISTQDVQIAVPLPANLAFDQQMFRLAEEDWLAHILVGYF